MARSGSSSDSDSSSGSSNSDHERRSKAKHRSGRRRRSRSPSRHKQDRRRKHRRSTSRHQRPEGRSRSRSQSRHSSNSASSRRDKNSLPKHSTVSISLRKTETSLIPAGSAIMRPRVSLASEKPDERNKAIASIETDDFAAQPFKSSRKTDSSDTGGLADERKQWECLASQSSLPKTDWSELPLCHPDLIGNPIEKERRWIEKLYLIRERLRQT